MTPDQHRLAHKLYVAMDELRVAARIISGIPGYEGLDPAPNLTRSTQLLGEVTTELSRSP